MSSKEPIAIVFDTFGSVVDWRGTLVEEMTALANKRGVRGDWEKIADSWREGYHRMLDEIVAGTRQWDNLDVIHRELLVEAMDEQGVAGFSDVLQHFGGGVGQIAIHGWNNDAVMGTAASNGCVRMRNGDIAQVAALAPVGTPVQIVA